MSEPTAPEPIRDLLAHLDYLETRPTREIDGARLVAIHPDLIEEIVRGVRDLAARVETLIEYVEANETLSGARRRTSNAEWRAALDDFQDVRRALLGEAK